jgi:hypothetical protein
MNGRAKSRLATLSRAPLPNTFSTPPSTRAASVADHTRPVSTQFEYEDKDHEVVGTPDPKLVMRGKMEEADE